MSKMRGVDPFNQLWERRTTINEIDLLSLPDLVKAKKTQQDKDWPMVSRLVESNYFVHRSIESGQDSSSHSQRAFWLLELRNAELLLQATRDYTEEAQQLTAKRPLLKFTTVEELEEALKAEELSERLRDREYWKPLRLELESLRRQNT